MISRVNATIYIDQIGGLWRVTAPHWLGEQKKRRNKGTIAPTDATFLTTTFTAALLYANSCIMMAKITRPSISIPVVIIEEGQETELTADTLPFYLLKYSD